MGKSSSRMTGREAPSSGSIALCRPHVSEVPADWIQYVDLVPAFDLLLLLDKQAAQVCAGVSGMPRSFADYAYAPGKWTVHQVLGHLIDTERIFAYRALAIARGERAELPGYDEEVYVRTGPHGRLDSGAIAEEYSTVRQSTLLLFRSMTAEAWLRRGTAAGELISVRAIAFVLAGHERHHMRVLRTRYGFPMGEE